MTDDQKSIVIDVQMRQGEKWFALEFDKKLRRCTGACLSQALKQGITKGDEVNYTINGQDLFSYLKKTGKTFQLDEKPQPATAPVIDAEKEQEQKQPEHGRARDPQNPEVPAPPSKESSRINHEVHRSEIIMWEALLNTAVKVVEMSGPYLDDEPRDVAKMVKETAVDLHAFIMEKVGEGK